MKILNDQQQTLLQSERKLLNDLQLALVEFGATQEDREVLRRRGGAKPARDTNAAQRSGSPVDTELAVVYPPPVRPYTGRQPEPAVATLGRPIQPRTGSIAPPGERLWRGGTPDSECY